jgi:hypothetical protein
MFLRKQFTVGKIALSLSGDRSKSLQAINSKPPHFTLSWIRVIYFSVILPNVSLAREFHTKIQNIVSVSSNLLT